MNMATKELLYQGKLTEALEVATEQDIDLLFTTGISYMESHGPVPKANAIKVFEKIMDLDPLNAETYNNLGIIAYRDRDYNLAENRYIKSIELSFKQISYHETRYMFFEKEKGPVSAEKEHQKAVSIYTNLGDTYYNLGILLYVRKRYLEAEVNYMNSISTYEEFLSFLKGTNIFSDEIYKNEIRKIDYRLADVHHNLGVMLEKNEKDKQAIENYKIAINLNPNLIESRNNLGILLQKQSKYDSANEEYEAIMGINPRYSRVYANQGILMDEQGNTKVENSFKEAIDIDPNVADFHYDLAIFYHKLSTLMQRLEERYDEAEIEYKKAISIHRTHADAHCNYGVLLQQKDRYEEALNEYTLALQANPNHGAAKNNLDVLAMMKDAKKT